MSINSAKKQTKKKLSHEVSGNPEKFQYCDHQIESQRISSNAIKIMLHLQHSGFSAYLVGGSVRDLLVNCEPKDFDVVTDASPEKIRKLFSRSRIIGRRFRLVHVYFRGEIIEVCTFRANSDGNSKSSLIASTLDEQPSILANDNTYGTIEEDAWRRDFTVNALYYNCADNTVIDYTGGMQDLKQKTIRMIGEPVQRFHEDPVRLLRAIRLAAKLNFNIDSAIERPLVALANLLYHVPPARILDELMKLFFKGCALVTFQKINHYGYFDVLFPQTALALQASPDSLYAHLLELALATTDERFYKNMSLNPAFLFSVFLWPAVQMQLQELEPEYEIFNSRLRVSVGMVLVKQQKICLLSRRLGKMIRSIWVLQYYLVSPKKHRVHRILQHRYFRAAVDFLQLRAQSGEPFAEVVKWWQRLRDSKPETVKKTIQEME